MGSERLGCAPETLVEGLTAACESITSDGTATLSAGLFKAEPGRLWR